MSLPAGFFDADVEGESGEEGQAHEVPKSGKDERKETATAEEDSEAWKAFLEFEANVPDDILTKAKEPSTKTTEIKEPSTKTTEIKEPSTKTTEMDSEEKTEREGDQPSTQEKTHTPEQQGLEEETEEEKLANRVIRVAERAVHRKTTRSKRKVDSNNSILTSLLSAKRKREERETEAVEENMLDATPWDD